VIYMAGQASLFSQASLFAPKEKHPFAAILQTSTIIKPHNLSITSKDGNVVGRAVASHLWKSSTLQWPCPHDQPQRHNLRRG
jgi:hypothetical protein